MFFLSKKAKKMKKSNDFVEIYDIIIMKMVITNERLAISIYTNIHKNSIKINIYFFETNFMMKDAL